MIGRRRLGSSHNKRVCSSHCSSSSTKILWHVCRHFPGPGLRCVCVCCTESFDGPRLSARHVRTLGAAAFQLILPTTCFHVLCYSLLFFFASQACASNADADQKDREARELAATRIQAVTRGNRFRKNNDLGNATVNGKPPRWLFPHSDGEEREHLPGKEGGGRYRISDSTGNDTETAGSGATAHPAARRSEDAPGGARENSADTASSAAAGGGGGGGLGAGGGSEEDVEIDRKTITLIASLVNERITVRERHSLPPRVYTCFQCSVAALVCVVRARTRIRYSSSKFSQICLAQPCDVPVRSRDTRGSCSPPCCRCCALAYCGTRKTRLKRARKKLSMIRGIPAASTTTKALHCLDLLRPGPDYPGGGGYTLAPACINSLCIPGNVINVIAVSSVPTPPPPTFSPLGGNEPPRRCSLGHPSYHDGSRRPTSRGVAAAAGEEGETGAAAARGEKSGSQRRRHGGGSVPAAAPSAREGGGATRTPNTHNTKPGCEIIKTWRGNGTVT